MNRREFLKTAAAVVATASFPKLSVDTPLIAGEETPDANQIPKTMNQEIIELLKQEGCDIVGFADLRILPEEARKGLDVGIIMGATYSYESMKANLEGDSTLFASSSGETGGALRRFTRTVMHYLEEKKYEAKRDNYNGSIVTDISDKTVGTLSGIGWIGRCALLVTEKVGPALRLAVVLTNAPLECGTPILKSQCPPDCTDCADICPTKAIKGGLWERGVHRDEFFDVNACLKGIQERRPMCGLCISSCPYTKGLQDFKPRERVQSKPRDLKENEWASRAGIGANTGRPIGNTYTESLDVEFYITPQVLIANAAVVLSGGGWVPTTWQQCPIGIRFSEVNNIDCYRGPTAGWAAIDTLRYRAHTEYFVSMSINVKNNTYSTTVWTLNDNGERDTPHRIAVDFPFRLGTGNPAIPQITAIDTLYSVSDEEDWLYVIRDFKVVGGK